MAQGSWRWGILGAGAAANGMAAALRVKLLSSSVLTPI